MMRMFNRSKELEYLKKLATGRAANYFLVGPCSSGKSELMNEVLADKSIVSFHIDCRVIERLEAKKAFIEEIEGLKYRMKAAAGIVVGAVAGAFGGSPDRVDFNQTTVNPIKQLDSLIMSAAAKGNKVVLFVDEVNVLRPELDATGLPKSPQEDALGQFFKDFQRLCISLTKQKQAAIVIQSSSDQMYHEEAALCSEKGFHKLLCLGYMAKEDVLTYLQEELKVPDKAMCLTIYEHFGGHFTHLQEAAEVAITGSKVDSTISWKKQ